MKSNIPWHRAKWKPSLDWSIPGAELLRRAAGVISERFGDRVVRLVVFGSSPLQMGVSSAIMSGDVDLSSEDDIETILIEAGLTKGLSSPYLEICPLGTFRTSLDWRERAHQETIGRIVLVFPHPIDILLSKIRRGEEKDFEAFEEVIRALGHPVEEELKDALIRAVELYRPGYDESAFGDPIVNTRLLWQRLFGRDIDVRGEIISKARRQ